MALTAQDARLNGRVGGLTYAAVTPPDEPLGPGTPRL